MSLAVSAQAAPFRIGASLQVYAFPRLVNGVYGRDLYADRAGAETYFGIKSLSAIGFDHVRLPVDVGPLLDDRDNKQWNAFLPSFLQFVMELHRQKLGVIVTLMAPTHDGLLPEQQLDGLKGPRFTRYAALAEQFARALQGLRIDRLALEPMNEPQQACVQTTGVDWTAYQAELLSRLRTRGPDLWLGVTGGCWSKIEGLVAIGPKQLRDPRTFVSVHFYDPFLFTHQGASWALDIMPLIAGLPFPATAGDRDAVIAGARQRAASLSPGDGGRLQRAEDAIREYFREKSGPASIEGKMDTLNAWCVSHDIPPDRVVFTEFGAMKTPDDRGSRQRWLADVSGAVRKRGWGATVWVLRGGPFGLDGANGALDPELLTGLGLMPAAGGAHL